MADLKIDFRELQCGILNELEKLDSQISTEVCSLVAGDYYIGNKIIVERKTLVDFLSSITSGRIFQQAYRMARSEKNCLIILEGDKSLTGLSPISRKAIQGVLIHLTVFLCIPVIHSRNVQETASLLMAILHQCRERELPVLKPIIATCPGIRINKKQRQKLLLIQNVPGIGTKRGYALLKYFSTIENVLNLEFGI